MDSEIRMEVVKGATIRSLLAELTGRYGGLSELLFLLRTPPHDLVNILKNGRNIYFLSGLDTPLEYGDVVALFPPVAGG
jgi:sulfur-carrier protein